MGISVNLKARIKRAFAPLARNADGSYAGGNILLNGLSVKAKCAYYVEWYEGSRRVQRAVGTVWRVALQTAKSQEHVLKLREAGEDVALPAALMTTERGPTVGAAIELYLRRPDLRAKSYTKYSRDLEDFRQFAQGMAASSVTEGHINKYIQHLQGKGYADATIADKVRTAVSAMREHGASINTKKVRTPKLTERLPEIYDLPVLERLFAAADIDERDLFKTFLLTGFRDQEVGYLTWPDVNFKAESIAVRKKIDFEVKDYEERIVPLFPELAQILRARRERYPGSYFIFATKPSGKRYSGGKRDKHMLRTLQRLALRAGLNCGECVAMRNGSKKSCKAHAVCREFGLHKFRKTYATMLLRDGFDLITVQKLLGHSDIDTTRKYLKGFVASELTAKIAASTLARPL